MTSAKQELKLKIYCDNGEHGRVDYNPDTKKTHCDYCGAKLTRLWKLSEAIAETRPLKGEVNERQCTNCQE